MTTITAQRARVARALVVVLGIVFVVLSAVVPGNTATGAPAAERPDAARAAVPAAVGNVHAPIKGEGSTWSANALDQWIRNVWSNYQWKITYNQQGSTAGRNAFANGTADFGVSEIPYAVSNSNEQDLRPQRDFAYMPIVAGGTAFMYNLQIGGKRVTNLRLSGNTIAKIFTAEITRWNDPQIKKDNPLLALPAIPIVPVVRSDGSGATAQFSIWMRQEQTALWDAYCEKAGRPMVNGHCGITSNYPVVPGTGFVSRAKSNGVASYVAQSHAVGAITFVEYSYALNAKFPVAKMLNESGYYTEPTAQNVAVALLRAKINQDKSSPDYLTQNLEDVYRFGDRRVYPLSSYSYIILPTSRDAGFTLDKGLTLADFGAYFLCEGQQQADVLGYSPLPINLVQAGQQQIRKIPGGDPVIKGIRDCNNPTFSPDGGNRLAQTAPYPPACDRQGSTQCLTGTGGAKDTSTSPSGGGSSDGPDDANGGSGGPGDAGSGGRDPGDSDGPDGSDDGPGGSGDGPGGGAEGDGNGATEDDLVDGGGDAEVVDDAAVVELVSATPQSIPLAESGIVPRLTMGGLGLAMIAGAVLPPLLGRRARPVLPGPAGLGRRGLAGGAAS
ncbi:phosphate ABC transporter substrate-binding protein PstS [Myceligenerans pegani]|uniref:Phosphate ABC transporter substrate-binding protein PstS n=1 Tax=Myceligenerans pegani TaxID=2776917 RepID=A0ABR9N1W3_9MICO|nr:phosphate ABC transporter substrate-binding protein PstS [Myceligenerans sp. TRM 65318]MBE1877647.1 phosphate ABC transporter substrate-binding protein PstS [Myceligenerans sp. TRM 65318]MBE3019918.1 phosphate ABC transporter substrate-binding protein PstS [Myceligenerans sp. TRM 65318]